MLAACDCPCSNPTLRWGITTSIRSSSRGLGGLCTTARKVIPRTNDKAASIKHGHQAVTSDELVSTRTARPQAKQSTAAFTLLDKANVHNFSPFQLDDLVYKYHFCIFFLPHGQKKNYYKSVIEEKRCAVPQNANLFRLEIITCLHFEFRRKHLFCHRAIQIVVI